MKIYGLGVDITNVDRIKKSLRNKGFIKRIFSSNEILKCKSKINKPDCFAKRFAAKEAFVKALGTGITSGMRFNEITVQNINSGKPVIEIIGKTKDIVNKIIKKKFIVYLSLSDDKPFAVATVIISI